MNSHDKAIAEELQINSFIEKKSASANVSDTKALVVNLSSYFPKENISEPKKESLWYDELHYGNYE
jgi:hypothetical protein